jgi:hypothetical protein
VELVLPRHSDPWNVDHITVLRYYFRLFSDNPVMLRFTTLDGGDCDVYVKRGAYPTRWDFDYFDIQQYSNFNITIDEPVSSLCLRPSASTSLSVLVSSALAGRRHVVHRRVRLERGHVQFRGHVYRELPPLHPRPMPHHCTKQPVVERERERGD